MVWPVAMHAWMTKGNLRLASLFVVMLSAGSAVLPEQSHAQSQPTVTAPSNYRALVARYMLATMPIDRKTLHTAQISKPFKKWGGLFSSKDLTAVCVSMVETRALFGPFTGYFIFAVDGGNVRRLETGNALIDPCPGMTPFPELRS